MEAYHDKFVDLLDCCMGSCCNGRRKKEEITELTLQRNAYGRKLMMALDTKGRRTETKLSQPNISKPLPDLPPGRASLSLGRPKRPSADLTDLVGSDSEEAPDTPPAHDRAWHEMLSSLHNALKHTRYSISGRMGMSVWGCANGARTVLSIICPIESKEAVKLWCISTGTRFSLTEAEPGILSYQAPSTPQHPSRTWRIRIRWLREVTFGAMPKIEMALRYDDGNPYAGEQVAKVNVLTLPALLDNCASAWTYQLEKNVREDSRLSGLEEDIFSILQRMMDLDFAEAGAGPLTEWDCRHVIRDNFWGPFTNKHPDSPAMFALCGLPIPQTPTHQPTTTQSSPTADMAYPRDGRFSDPRRAPPVPPKDNGRDLTPSVVRRNPGAGPEQPNRRGVFLDLVTTPRRREPQERARRNSEEARSLEEQVRRGALRLDKRESGRRSHHHDHHHRRGASEPSGEGKPKARHGSLKEDGGSGSGTRRREGTRASRDALSRAREDMDRECRRGSDPGASPARGTSGSARVDGTKVSEWDPSVLERSASGSGRIPLRGYFANLYIVDDGEEL